MLSLRKSPSANLDRFFRLYFNHEAFLTRFIISICYIQAIAQDSIAVELVVPSDISQFAEKITLVLTKVERGL